MSALPPAARHAAGALRGFARCALLVMGAAMLWGDAALQANPLQQLRAVGLLVLVPEAAAWCLLRAFAAQAALEGGALVLTRGTRRLLLPAAGIVAVEPWRLPLPAAGVSLRLADGRTWRHGLAFIGAIAETDAAAFARALSAAGAALGPPSPSPALAYAEARRSVPRGRLDHPLSKFAGLSLLLALPAFRLHQHIAYGSAVGEWLSFGLRAYATTFVLWWAAWAAGVLLCAAALRAAIEAGTLLLLLLRPARAAEARRWLERAALAALYLGLPAWLLWRLTAA